MRLPITQTRDKKVGGLFSRYLFGLNIFPDNYFKSHINDPRLEFLRLISDQNQVSINTGNLLDVGNNPEDIFGRIRKESPYEIVKIGCHGGEFFDSNIWNTFPALFFPCISSTFFDLTRDYDNDSLSFSILYGDAMALFVSPKTENSINELRGLLNSTFPIVQSATISTNDFLEKASNHFELIILSHADGDYFQFITTNTASFQMIEDPHDVIVKSIEATAWYQENAERFVWDDKLSMCLVLE